MKCLSPQGATQWYICVHGTYPRGAQLPKRGFPSGLDRPSQGHGTAYKTWHHVSGLSPTYRHSVLSKRLIGQGCAAKATRPQEAPLVYSVRLSPTLFSFLQASQSDSGSVTVTDILRKAGSDQELLKELNANLEEDQGLFLQFCDKTKGEVSILSMLEQAAHL